MTFLRHTASRHVTTVTSWIFMEAESQEVRVFHDVYIYICIFQKYILHIAYVDMIIYIYIMYSNIINVSYEHKSRTTAPLQEKSSGSCPFSFVLWMPSLDCKFGSELGPLKSSAKGWDSNE